MFIEKAIQLFLQKAPFGRQGEKYEIITIPKGKKERLVLALQYLLNEGVLKYPPKTCGWQERLVTGLLDQLDRKLTAAGFKTVLREDGTKKLIVYVRPKE